MYGGSDVVDNECDRTGSGSASAVPRLFSAVFCSQIMSLAMRPGVTGRDDVGVLAWERLCTRCARTRWPAARALRSESSPAITEAAIMQARRWAFWPGAVWWAPLMPNISRTEPWGPRTVPPPTVPTSMQGMDTVIRRSSPSLVLRTVISIKHRKT